MSSSPPIPVRFLFHPVHFLSLGLGSGLSPKAPGTFGTLAALIIFVAAYNLFGEVHWGTYLAVLLVTTVLGIYLCGKTAKDLGVHDHGGIVWDEFVGFWLCMLLVPVTWFWLLSAFVLFRIFDIVKPWPIKWIDQKVSGGFGIMLDDLLAGVYVLILLHLAKVVLPPSFS